MTDKEKLHEKICAKCGLPMSRNPHPNAGKPPDYLEVGTIYECIPCLVLNRHKWAGRAMKAEAELAKLSEPVSEDLVEQVAHGFSEHKAGHCPPTSNEAICADLKSCCNLCWTKHVISLIRPVIEKEEKDKWIAACAYHGIKIEQPQQLKRIIAQLKEAGE